jgi:hypothetical protein
MTTYVLRITPGQPDVVQLSDGANVVARHCVPFGNDLIIAGHAPPTAAVDIPKTYGSGAADQKLLPIGAHLWDLLVQPPPANAGSVGYWLEEMIKSPDRVVLDLPDAWLRALPWELLTSPKIGAVFQRGSVPWSLGSSRYPRPAETFEWPLRVLIVVTAPWEEPNNIRPEKEVADLELLFRANRNMVAVRVVAFDDPGPEEIGVRLGAALADFRPHVLHVIGHGGVQRADGVDIGTLMCGASDSDIFWNAQGLSALLPEDGPHPRLVVLNICSSAATQDPLWDVTDVFFRHGANAVVGMQTRVEDTAARALGHQLYVELLERQPIDIALAKARRKLAKAPGRTLHDWSSARLKVAVAPEKALSLAPAPNAAIAAKLGQCSELQKSQYFVNQDEATYRAHCALLRRARCFVHGPQNKGIGRSSLVRVVLESAALAGHQIRYISLAGMSNTWIDLLRYIRDVGPPHASAAERGYCARDWEVPDAFAPFHSALNYALETGGPPIHYPHAPIDSGAVRTDLGDPVAKEVIGKFASCLKAATGDQSTVIALDAIPTNFSADVLAAVLVPYLFQALDGSKIRFVVVMDSIHFGKVFPAGHGELAISLGEWPGRVWRRQAGVLVRWMENKGIALPQDIWTLVDAWGNRALVSPRILKVLQEEGL